MYLPQPMPLFTTINNHLHGRLSTLNTKKNSATLELAFSLFTYWFNPLSNKASEKQVSLGVLALNFLNLPPNSQWKVENTFLSGLVPEPTQPNMVTINNILKAFVDEILRLDSGIIIQTSQYPIGRRVLVGLGCLIGVLVANHKVAGFSSHSSTLFCSWCDCSKANLKQLKIRRLRQKRHVKDRSQAFKQLHNEAECTRMVKKTYIRWSELNFLEYWDACNRYQWESCTIGLKEYFKTISKIDGCGILKNAKQRKPNPITLDLKTTVKWNMVINQVRLACHGSKATIWL
ncbi:hypothetical protein O181_036320 [Austropuccinia psidii MF-1]|uniref:Uncharacterized protein n=1 Tax=Austropuccinia psidii MF-1 TaxID=1389203 RepID=A0A9Q3D6D0_9BASI|nr:hypothetical protein [Austropuccinia psidii MF-1]